MEDALADAKQWMGQVKGALDVDCTPPETLNELSAAADDLLVELSNAAELKEDLGMKIASQALDGKIEKALAKPGTLEDLESLRCGHSHNMDCLPTRWP